MSSDDVQEVTPELVEPPELSTRLDQAVAKAVGMAETWPERFQPRVPADGDDYRQAKRERTALRKELSAITDGRKAMFAPWKDAIKRGEARFADVLARGREMDAAYKDGIDEYERGLAQSRMESLAGYYADLAPMLVPLVPLEAIDARWGAEDGWHKVGASEVRMREQLEGHVQEIADNEALIKSMHYDQDDEEALRRRYLATLDFRGACVEVQAERERRERLRELDRQRAQARADEEQAPEAAQADGAAACGHEVEADGQLPIAERQAPQAGAQAPTAASGVIVFRVEVPRAKAREFVAAMRRIGGVHGRPWRGEDDE
ncbi:MAG: hypothetical protein ACI38Z_04615 [Parafannyhessea sp.]|uniref:hypothetical protein n=1 Tax=Parafannyhessea sp. TaxID=2847324 RepID=UPI003F0B03CB